MCLVCTNVTQVLQHLFLRSPSNSLLMRSLESRCGPRSAGDSPQIWLEIALTELRAPLLRVMTNTWTLDSGLVSGGHSRVCHHIRRPQPGLTRNALILNFFGSVGDLGFQNSLFTAKLWLPPIAFLVRYLTETCCDNMNTGRDILYPLDYQIIHLKFSEVIV